MESVIENDLILKRIKHFEEKVKHCEKQFSVQVLSDFLAEIESTESFQQEEGLVSFENLENFLFKKEERCPLTGEPVFVSSKTRLYLEWFVNLLKCLKTFYERFVREIYSPLLADLNGQIKMTQTDDRSPLTSGSDTVSSDALAHNIVARGRIVENQGSVLTVGDLYSDDSSKRSFPMEDSMVSPQGIIKTYLPASQKDHCAGVSGNLAHHQVLDNNRHFLTFNNYPPKLRPDDRHDKDCVPKAVQKLFVEYEDLKELYDFSTKVIISDRLTRLVTTLDTLFDINWVKWNLILPRSLNTSKFTKAATVSHDYVATSSNVTIHSNQERSDILKLIPDIFIKLRKMAWVATKWHTLNYSKTSTIEQRIKVVERVENKLSINLIKIDGECDLYEKKVEENVQELNFRLAREERSIELGIALSKLDSKKCFLQAKVEKARHNRNCISQYILEASVGTADASRDMELMEKIRKNCNAYQTQLLSLGQEISLVDFRRKLLEEDQNIEIDLKPSFVAWTNSCQESLEQREAILDDLKQRKSDIEMALKYVRKNKRYLPTLSFKSYV